MKSLLITISILLCINPAQASTWQIWDIKSQVLTVYSGNSPDTDICYQGSPDLYTGECDLISRALAKAGVGEHEVEIITKDTMFFCGPTWAMGCYEQGRAFPVPRISVYGENDQDFELILLHELAHYLYPDYTEEQADDFALSRYY